VSGELTHADRWASENPAYAKLVEKGYSVGGYIDNEVPKYALYRITPTVPHLWYEMVHTFDTPEELSNMVKLLLDE
jgi:hypothetical protein